MSLDFITTEPAAAAFRTGTEFENQQRTVREKRNVDTAVRGGLAEILAPQQQAAPALGAMNPIGTPAPAPAPVQAPAPAPAPVPVTRPNAPPTISVMDSGAPPGVRPPPATGSTWRETQIRYESNGNPTASNPRSSSKGLGQFIDGTWLGLLPSIRPDLVVGRTREQQLALRTDPAVSRQMMDGYNAQNEAALTRAGQPVNDGTRSLAYMFDAPVAARILSADPNTPIASIVGERVMRANPTLFGRTAGSVAQEHQNRFAGGGGTRNAAAAPQAAPGITSGDAAAAGSAVSLNLGGTQQQSGGRYDPILSRLAETPGGGATALSLMGQQAKQDALQGTRANQYQRLAMQALGRGDTDVFKYYSQLGGLQIPDAVTANAGMSKRLATISLVAERFYKDDPAQAQKLTSAYLQTGSIDQAFAAAGVPTRNPRLTLQWLRQGEQEVAGTFNPATGTLTPAMGPDGQPVTRDVKPGAENTRVQWVRQADGTERAMQVQGDQMVPVTGPDGQPMTQAPKTANSARVADRTTRLQMLRAAGVDEQAANLIAAGATPSPNTMAGVYAKVIGAFERNVLTSGDTPEQVQDKTATVMTTMFGPAWQQTMQGRPGGAAAPTIGPNVPAAPAAAPAAPAAAPAPAPVPTPAPAAAPTPTMVRPANIPRGSQWSPTLRQFRDPNGNMYDERGNPIQAQPR